MNSAAFFETLGSLTSFTKIFGPTQEPWLWLAKIPEILRFFGENSTNFPDFSDLGEGIYVHSSAKIDAAANVIGPCIIGANCIIRCNAFLRENILLGSGCTVGHCSEIKNSIVLDRAQIAHRNYVGDSILGNGTHLGSGAVLANLRLDGKNVRIHGPTKIFDSGLRKFGAILGDGAQVGCNAVLQPGTVLGKDSQVHAAVAFSGFLPSKCAVCHSSKPKIIFLPE